MIFHFNWVDSHVPCKFSRGAGLILALWRHIPSLNVCLGGHIWEGSVVDGSYVHTYIYIFTLHVICVVWHACMMKGR